ncbi:hypothetical protein K4K49_009228 [Colletotrichum sp. SAR 10_70]|nr:hypothetical protein K4K50_009178 [Colletotrichum sp. SAR 10_71]KAI8155624.1 hypothetical protein K4K49_009228 [Colletotrichum sp. SAR 10_70]KAJ4995452.1 hypothetical protein K4K48_010319 [Colletotrichum sp. SAR 10_66]
MLRMTRAQSLLDSIMNNVNAVADKTLDRVEEDCFKAPPKALGIGKAPKQQGRKVKFLGVLFIRVSGAGEAVPDMPQATAIWYLPASTVLDIDTLALGRGTLARDLSEHKDTD